MKHKTCNRKRGESIHQTGWSLPPLSGLKTPSWKTWLFANLRTETGSSETTCCGDWKDFWEGNVTHRFNKIFGGFIMRQAFELGWANAHVFGNFYHLDKDWYPFDNKVYKTFLLKVNADPGVCIWTTSGSELPLRSEPCSTSTPRSAMFK